LAAAAAAVVAIVVVIVDSAVGVEVGMGAVEVVEAGSY
jgi:hypothetical protein